jgi:hypothetical protein
VTAAVGGVATGASAATTATATTATTAMPTTATTAMPATNVTATATPATNATATGAALAGAGVVQVPGPEAARLRTPVFLTRTGGFVGANDRISITRSGAWLHRDLRTGATRSGQLERWQIQQLNRLLDRARGTTPGQAPRGCADAFRFRLVAGGLRASYEECGQRVGPVGDVVQFILRVAAG